MKKLFFALIMGAALMTAPACKKDDDKEKGGGTTPPAVSTLVGSWNMSEYSFDGTFDVDFMGVNAQVEINGEKVSGSGTISFEANNTISASGIIQIETQTTIKAFGQVLFSDSDTDDEDLVEMFDGGTYQILSGNKVRMNFDGTEAEFDYVFGTNSATLTGVVEFEDDDFGDDPVLMNVLIKLTK